MTALPLIVMPRSRSSSIWSINWATISWARTVPVISKNRSAKVDLPWSMWAMMQKLRMNACCMRPLDRSVTRGMNARRPVVLPDLS